MKLKIQKQTTSEMEVEIQLPAFFHFNGLYKKLTIEGELITVAPSGPFASIINSKSYGYDRAVNEVLTARECSSEEFEAAKDKTLTALHKALEFHETLV